MSLININKVDTGKNNGQAIQKVGVIAAFSALAGTVAVWVGRWFTKKKEGENKKEAIREEKEAKLAVMREASRLKKEELDKEHEIWKDEQAQKFNEFIERERIKKQSAACETNVVNEDSPKEEVSAEDAPFIPDVRFLKTNTPPKAFLVPRLISEGEIAAIFGHEKIGKSYLGAQIAKDSTLGGFSSLFPNEAVAIPKCEVYYYAAENWKDDMSKRLPNGFIDDHDNIKLLDVSGYSVDKLLELMKYQTKTYTGSLPLLFIIDNLSGIVDNVYSGEVDSFISELVSLRTGVKEKEVSLTIILFAHDKADKDLASAPSVGRKVSTIIRFSESDYNEDERIIEIVRSNLHKKDKIYLQFKKDTQLHLEHIEVADANPNDEMPKKTGVEDTKSRREWTDEDDSKLKELVQKGLHADEIATIMKRKEAVIGRHAHDLNIVISPRKPGRKAKP